jgi:large repetitive protein
MGYAKYVGRVGALAVALGVGTAVTGGYGTALADDATASSVESPGPTGPPSTDAGVNRQRRRATKPDLPHAIVAGVRDALGGGHSDATPVGPRKGPKLRPKAGDDDAAAQKPSTDGSETTAAPHESRQQPPNRTVRIARPHLTQVVERVSQQVEKQVEQVDRRVDVTTQKVTELAAPSGSSLTHTALSAPEFANVAVEQQVKQVSALVTPRAPVRTVIAGLLSALDHGLAPGGGVPAPAPENPVLAAVLGWVRRIERTFDNRTPVTRLDQDEIVQTDRETAVGYLDPTDADGDKLTYSATTTAKDTAGNQGSVAFDPATPGKFTYTAPPDRDMTKEWTDTVTITTSDEASAPHIHGLLSFLNPDGGHTATQTVVVKIEPIEDPTVDQTTGIVTGKVPDDTEALHYTVAPVDDSIGAVEVDRDTGTWTFTPKDTARVPGGPGTVEFTITAVDADGHQTPIKQTAEILPASVVTVPVPPGATPVTVPAGTVPSGGGAVAGPGGSIAVTSYDTKNDETFLVVRGIDGQTHTSAPLPGNAVGSPVFDTHGVAYQATKDTNGQTYVNIVTPDGPLVSTKVKGDIQGPIAFDDNGNAYVTSVVDNSTPQPVAFAAFSRSAASPNTLAASAADGDTDGITTYMTVVDADGTPHEYGPLAGRPTGDVVIGADGTVYQTTSAHENGDYTTHLGVLHTDGSFATHEYVGQASRVVVDSHGTAYQVAYHDDTDQSFVNIVNADGTEGGALRADGAPAGGGPVVGPTGNFNMTTVYTGRFPGSYFTTYIPGVRSTIVELPGATPYGDMVVRPDGTVYQTTVHNATDTEPFEATYVTRIDAHGDPVDSEPIPGTPSDSGVLVAPDGTPYHVTTLTDGLGVERTVVTKFDDNVSGQGVALPGTPTNGSTRFGPDGTVYQGTQTVSDTGTVQAYANIIGSDGVVHTTALPGDPVANSVVIAPNGTVYQTTVDYENGKTYVNAIGTDGTVHFSYAAAGLPTNDALVVGEDGTVYQTTSSYDADTDTSRTYVTTIDANGVVRESDPIPGDAPSGVIFGTDGTPVQSAGTGIYTLDPTSWTPRRAPSVIGHTVGAVDPVDGSVGGTVAVTDPDGDTLHYALDPTSTLDVDVDPNTGAWTYTPSVPDRSGSYYGTGPDQATFSIIATDGGYNAPVSITVPIDPLQTGAPVPVSASTSSPAVQGANGDVYQAYTGNNGKTYITTTSAGGTVHAIALQGDPAGDLAIDPNGNVYQSTATAEIGTGEAVAYVTVVHPDGTHVTTDALPGDATRMVMGPDGRVFQINWDQGITHVNLVHPDGTVTTRDIAGGPTQPTFTSDGTMYLPTYSGDGGAGVFESRVTVFRPDGTDVTSDAVAGVAVLPAVVGPDGRVALTVYDPSHNQLSVDFVSADGAISPNAVPGIPVVDDDGKLNPVYAPDGTLYLQTHEQSGTASYLNVFRPDGSLQTVNLPGAVANASPVLGQDGKAYQLSADDPSVDHADGLSYVTVVDPDGTVHSSTPLTGTPATTTPLVVAPDGAVYATTTGDFGTQVASVAPDGSLRVSAPLSGNANTGVVIASNGEVSQTTESTDSDGTVHSTVTVLDPSTWTAPNRPPVKDGAGFSVTGVDTSDGRVTGTVDVADPDGDAVHYSLDPASTLAVDVDPDTGNWTYTPTAEDRSAAYYGAGPADVTFKIIASDGEDQTPVSVTAAIDPAADGQTVTLPAGAAPTSGFVTDANGNAYQTSYNDSTHTSYVTVIGADGHAHTSGPLPGSPIDPPAPGADGATYQVTTDGTKTYVNVIGAEGASQSVEVPGNFSGSLVMGPNGIGYLTTNTATPASPGVPSWPGGNSNPGPTVPDVTYVTVVGPDGAVTTAGLPGRPGPLSFGPDGTAYQLTTQGGPGDTQTFVTVVDEAGGTHTSDAITGDTSGKVVFGSEGTPFVTTYSGEQTWVTAIDSEGHLHTSAPITGDPDVGATVGRNGIVYQTTRLRGGASEETLVTAVNASGDVVGSYTLPGTPIYGPGIDGDGNVYQTYVDFDADETHVAIIPADGSTINYGNPIPGVAHYAGVQFASNGVGYLITDTSDTDATNSPYDSNNVKTYMTSIAANGDTVVSAAMPGQASDVVPYFGPDGTQYLTTYTWHDGNYDHAYLTALGSDGTRTVELPGAEPYYRGIATGSDGTVYVVSVDRATQKTYVTTVDSDGVVHDTSAVPGTPADNPLTVAPDGTVYLTSTTYDDVRGSSTYLAALGTDGSYRLSDPVAGYPKSGVVIGPDGTIYQTTDAGTKLVDPADTADWELHHAPTVGLPIGAAVRGPVVVAADGTGYQTSYDSATNQSYVTVIGADGTAHTTGPLPGVSLGTPMTAPDGTAYLSTEVNGPTYDDDQSYVNVIATDGTVISAPVVGHPELVAVHDGRAYFQSSEQVIVDGNVTIVTRVTVIGPDGVAHTNTMSGPGGLGPFAPDGTAYVTTSTYGQGGSTTSVTAITPDGVARPGQPLAGEAAGNAVVASDGTVYQATRATPDPVTGEARTWLYAIGADGSASAPATLVGSAYGDPVVGAAGTVYQTTSTGDQNSGLTYVTAVGPNGAVTSHSIPGAPLSQLVVSADGTAYQTTYDIINVTTDPVTGNIQSDSEAHLAIVGADGTTHITPVLQGQPIDGGLVIGADGTAYQVSEVDTESSSTTYLYTIAPNGDVLNTVTADGYAASGGVLAGPNGAIYLTTAHFDPNGDITTVKVIQADGTTTDTDAYGIPYGERAFGTDGTVYQTTTDPQNEHSYVVTIRPNGTVESSALIPGTPYGVGDGHELAVGPNGTAFQTTYDAAADRTYVTVIGADGSTRTSTPLPGAPEFGGVAQAPNGTVYQTTSAGTFVVDIQTAGSVSI